MVVSVTEFYGRCETKAFKGMPFTDLQHTQACMCDPYCIARHSCSLTVFCDSAGLRFSTVRPLGRQKGRTQKCEGPSTCGATVGNFQRRCRIHIHECMYVCMYVCKCVCVDMCTSTHTCVYIYIYTYIYIYICVCVYVYIYIALSKTNRHVCNTVCTYVWDL